MTTNIELALLNEDEFTINVVNEVLTKEYVSSLYSIYDVLENYASSFIKYYITTFPHLADNLKNNSFKLGGKRELLLEECSKLSVAEVKEFVDSIKSSNTTRAIWNLIDTVLLNLPSNLLKAGLGHIFQLDLTHLTKEQDAIIHRAIIYITLLYP